MNIVLIATAPSNFHFWYSFNLDVNLSSTSVMNYIASAHHQMRILNTLLVGMIINDGYNFIKISITFSYNWLYSAGLVLASFSPHPHPFPQYLSAMLRHVGFSSTLPLAWVTRDILWTGVDCA